MAAAGPASPAKSSTEWEGNFCPLALRVPAVIRTGNNEQDQKAESDRHLFQVLITECVRDPSHIIPLYTALQKRLIARAQNGYADFGEQAFRTVSILSRLDQDWMCYWLASVSDMSASEIAKAKEYDSEAVWAMVCFGLQWPPTLRLPKECQVKAVMTALADARHTIVGQRLQNFKAKIAFQLRDGALNWGKYGCYSLEFDGETCTRIKHIATGHTAMPPAGTSLTRKFSMENNFSDMEACIHLPPMPAVKLCCFFSKDMKQGPYSYDVFKGGSDKKFNQLAMKEHADWKDKQEEALKASSGKDVTAVKQELAKVDASRRRKGMEKARAAAAVAFEEKKKRRTITLAAP